MKVSDLKKILETMHDETEVLIECWDDNAGENIYLPAKVLGEFITRPAGWKNTVTSWAVTINPSAPSQKSETFIMVDGHLEYPL